MENVERIKVIIEALLIVSEEGISREEFRSIITDSDGKDIEQALTLLKEEYASDKRAFNIAEIAGKCRIVTKPEFVPWINNLYQRDNEKLSGPSLETLAILAYKQPATRAEIESVRGVNVGGVIKTLLEKEMIEIRGRKDVIGRPLLYGTTEKFLEFFGLNSLDDLPGLREFSEDDLDFNKTQLQAKNAREESAENTDSVNQMKREGHALEYDGGDTGGNAPGQETDEQTHEPSGAYLPEGSQEEHGAEIRRETPYERETEITACGNEDGGDQDNKGVADNEDEEVIGFEKSDR
ncbi:MAG: SMC-Scp complex subunit ScpB [Candidatus Omnitrophota bacterium]